MRRCGCNGIVLQTGWQDLTNVLQVTILFIIKKLKGNDKEEYMTTAARESATS